MYGEVEEALEIKEDVRRLEARIVTLNKALEQQERTIQDLSKFLESKVEKVTKKLFDKYMDEYTKEIDQTRLDFIKRHAEEAKKKPSKAKVKAEEELHELIGEEK